jgi:hypothetical protein
MLLQSSTTSPKGKELGIGVAQNSGAFIQSSPSRRLSSVTCALVLEVAHGGTLILPLQYERSGEGVLKVQFMCGVGGKRPRLSVSGFGVKRGFGVRGAPGLIGNGGGDEYRADNSLSTRRLPRRFSSLKTAVSESENVPTANRDAELGRSGVWGSVFA